MAFLNGTFSGIFHALTGPDHIAAVLPPSIHKSYHAWTVGFYWGVGHSIGIVLFGLFAHLIAYLFNFDLMFFSRWIELFVGVSLIGFGAMGFYEANAEVKKYKVQDEETLSETESYVENDKQSKSTLYIVTTSTIQGFTGTGQMFGIAPALALPDFYSVMLYFIGFTIGTVIIMVLLTTLIGVITTRMVGSMTFIPDLHIKLSKWCSGISIFVGILFIISNLLSL